MPKYQPSRMSFAGCFFLAALASAFAYLVMSKTAAVAVALALLFCVFLAARPAIKRQEEQLRSLAATREGESICEFAREFDLRAIDTWIVRAVYEQLQKQLEHIHPAFPLRADDKLKDDLHLDDDDLDMVVAVQVEQRTGRSLENLTANPYAGKVRSVRDLVLVFQAQAPRSVA